MKKWTNLYHEIGDGIYTRNLDADEEKFLAKVSVGVIALSVVVIVAHFTGLVDYLLALI